MSELQIAVLILGGVVALSLLVLNRRARAGGSRREPLAPSSDPVGDILEAGDGRDFDEFGVSRPRKSDRPVVVPAVKPPPTERIEPTVNVPSNPLPAFVRAVTPKPVPAPTVQPPLPLPVKVPEKIVALYVAEKEGTRILGTRIHAALEAQKLDYNEKNKAYDRRDGERSLFTVTALTAPGHLDRDQSAAFSTPGLGLFLRLPGPTQPAAAFRDLVATAYALAQSLNAVLFDAGHQPLTDATLRRLASEVDDWARKYLG